MTSHFDTTLDRVAPQPWMQLRNVATGGTESVSRSYDPSDGSAKNDEVQTLTVAWTNTTPVPQWVYGLVTKSGSQVSLQCRSRGYMGTSHAVTVMNLDDLGSDEEVALELIEVSRFGVGSDLGNGGILNIGGAFGISELRQNSVTMPLMPHLTQWNVVPVGETITAQVVVTFISEYWESSMIDGGDGDTESKIVSGDLRIDLFALPALSTPLPRLTPTVVGSRTGIEIGLGLEVECPAGVVEGDRLIAFCGNQFGADGAITAPNGWTLMHQATEVGLLSVNKAHLKVFTKVAAADETSNVYEFGNGLFAEAIVTVVAIRDADSFVSDANSSGWGIASTRRKWARTGSMHIAPSIDRAGQLLLCASFFGRTDNPLDQLLGPAPCTQTSPDGMVEVEDVNGVSASMNVAYMANPPKPTRERTFMSTPRAFFIAHAVTVSIVIPGAADDGS